MLTKIFILLAAAGFIAGIGRFSYASSCCSAGKMQGCRHSSEAAGGSAAAPSKKAVNLGNKICPVTGEKIGDSGMKPAIYQYKDKIYNLCCKGCVAKFMQDPEKYVQKAGEQAAPKEESPGQVEQPAHHH